MTLDLTDGTYQPYRKPDDEPLYINRLSNHLPAVVNQLHSSINKRINKLSCNKQTFDASSQLYNDALRQSNFDATRTYEQPTCDENNSDSNRTQRRNRQRNTIWYNLPYSKNVKTNILQRFLQLIDKHFPPSNKLNKVFNRHNVQISYSCLHNTNSFINRHNRKILNKQARQTNAGNTDDSRQCNCRQQDKCPTEGKCLTKSVVYQAEVLTDNNEPAKYIGVTTDDIKTRYRNHAKSFTNKKYSMETELSKHVWKLKAAKKPFSITYKAGSRRCNLCLEKKLTILKTQNNSLLSKRSELFTKCRHETRYLISYCK